MTGTFTFAECYPLSDYRSPIDHRLTRSGRRHVSAGSGASKIINHSLSEPLTQREQTVLDLIVQGSTSKEASEALGISPRTVEFHRANIMLKYSARNVADLMRMVMKDQ